MGFARLSLGAVVLGTLLLAPGVSPSFAAFDAYLAIDGIEGDSTASKHKGDHDVLSYTWGATQSGTFHGGGGGTAGRVNMQDLTITKQLDGASPVLAQAVAEGRRIASARLTLRRAGGNKEKYMDYVFTNVVISSIQQGGSAQGEGGVPIEEVGLNFSKIQWKFFKVGTDGKPQGAVVGCWDVQTNNRC